MEDEYLNLQLLIHVHIILKSFLACHFFLCIFLFSQISIRLVGDIPQAGKLLQSFDQPFIVHSDVFTAERFSITDNWLILLLQKVYGTELQSILVTTSYGTP